MKQKIQLQHAELNYFSVNDSGLIVAGKSIPQVIAIAGQTPCYIYDRSVIIRKVEEFRAAIPDRIKLHYAMKANPHPSLVSLIADHVDGLDVASLKELRVALATRTAAGDISFAGPAKSVQDIAGAVAANIVLNIESATELSRAVEAGDRLGIQPKIALRINPDFELKSSGMKMGGGPKQFGIDAEQIPSLLKKMKNLNVTFCGFHIYSGSQNLSDKAIIEAHNKTFDLSRRMLSGYHEEVVKLNIGGGFGIPYFPGETPLILDTIGANLANLLDEYREFSETEIIIELGRFLVGESGIYVTRVLDKKISRELTYLLVDGGLHHHLANSGNFGQVIRKNYPVTVVNNSREQSDVRELVSVVGPLCTPLDTLADKMNLPKADIGDFVVIFQSGAYGATASPTAFLSQPELTEVLI